MILAIVSNKQLCHSRLRFWGIFLYLLALSSFSLSKTDFLLFVQYHDILLILIFVRMLSFRCVTPGTIPHICQFWYTAALFRTVIVHQKVSQLLTEKICQHGPKFRALYAKKYTSLKNHTTAISGASEWR